jgi:amino acid transporter
MIVLRGTDACLPSPGPFNTVYAGDTPVGGSWGHFLAFWSSTITAAFSFLGTEIVAVTAGEAANPRKTMPGAIRRVFWRLLMFYVLGVRSSFLGLFRR